MNFLRQFLYDAQFRLNNFFDKPKLPWLRRSLPFSPSFQLRKLPIKPDTPPHVRSLLWPGTRLCSEAGGGQKRGPRTTAQLASLGYDLVEPLLTVEL